MNVIVKTLPARHKVTASMLDDFLTDPVLAAKVIMGYDLDAFQRCRLRYNWWVPFVVDSSGYSTGKTIGQFIYACLRAILLPQHDVGVYYPIFETGKNTFWRYFERCRAPIFQAHLGRLAEEGESEGKRATEGSACFKAYFKTGGTIFMPAPSFMKKASTQASMRFGTIVIEEWTHIDAMTPPGEEGGIDAQLIGRVTAEPWNQNHPIWTNHIKFSAPAKPTTHPGYRRYRTLTRKANGVTMNGRRVGGGDPHFASISYSFKDWSQAESSTGKSWRDRFRIQANIDAKRAQTMSPADWMGEGLGIWAASGAGWYREDAITACQELGRQIGLAPLTGRLADETQVGMKEAVE